MIFERIFKLRENHTNLRTEVLAGTTTFLTMSYIIFVQPAVLSTCGMDFGSVMVATCIASAIACIFMAFLANYPIALAPAMGHNFYFAFTVCGPVVTGGMGYPWQVALGANLISGTLFFLLSFFGLRELLVSIIPDSLKNAIAVGIGLLIALVGFEYGGVIVDTPGALVGLGNPKYPEVWVSLFGMMVMGVMIALKIKGAILYGIIATALASIPLGMVQYQGVTSMPPSIDPTLLKCDPVKIFTEPGFISVIFVLLFLDVFDTIGTVVGIGEQGGFYKNGKIPRVKQILLSDALGTVGGALLGTSTITSYIESSAGIQAGGRTGLSNIITACLFLLSLFFYPLIKMIGGGYQTSNGAHLYPIIAPALIIVGSMMIFNVRKIRWDDPTESLPSFLTLSIMPFSLSITEGLSFGFISYSLLKLITGRFRGLHWAFHLVSVAFLVRYIFLKM
ncbi:MAG: NCS2 family permease [Candidatus Brocadia sp. AMX2]|uniref:MFS transporter AGZA family xanthine/uracil permease n=1 Tax=Candidatus Brocadia sinica JPN1 TaxID=1197129 RepID=A0ABQ0K2W7_9BACT|nr:MULTISPECIES: NCS2 family permease [Brocadia]MBC6932315.1 NCS2 family permease [Candidatus Brocadia sp.]MBL1169811.1 NCS2 family permease [Candidatus Brocadia sp. AMX1]MCK6469268.1 NCS2 family permease [Candidatus Brocadia sinica]NOG40353.1 NCS2 family permease [Planctomycetota bacterium]KAA0245068.1 MAG: NCS2 family permease [Candidatus Brocadia sp. AMX2]